MPTKKRRRESGNVFFTLFGAVALVGVVGASSMQIMKGPVRSMAEVTKRTVAENAMIASGKLAVSAASTQPNGGNCDTDEYIEPIMPDDAGASPKPAGGGYLPPTIGATLNDPWGTRYALCVWDHGSVSMNASCDNPPSSGTNRRLGGVDGADKVVLAVISAGMDKAFQSYCYSKTQADTKSATDSAGAAGNSNGNLDGAEQLFVKVGGSDDVVMMYPYAQAANLGGGLWTLNSSSSNVAELKNSSGVVAASIDRDTGTGEFVALKANTIFAKAASPNNTVVMGDTLRIKNVAGLPPPTGIGGGFTEADPQVGTLTNTKWCTTDGTAINCTSDAPTASETDPQVGTLTNSKWCTTDGAVVSCTSDAPTGSDNLGNHTATQNVVLGTSNWLTGDGTGNDGVRISAAGNVGINMSPSSYPLEVNGIGYFLGANGFVRTQNGGLILDSNVSTENPTLTLVNDTDLAGSFRVGRSASGQVAGDVLIMSNHNAGDIILQPGNATGTGEVGVGINEPLARLHVAGTGRFDGQLDSSGSIRGSDFRSTYRSGTRIYFNDNGCTDGGTAVAVDNGVTMCFVGQ